MYQSGDEIADKNNEGKDKINQKTPYKKVSPSRLNLEVHADFFGFETAVSK